MDRPLAVPTTPARPVAEGPPPLVYIVSTPSMVRVIDMTLSAEILRIPVTARSIVSINAERGVLIGSAVMRRGPLAADHKYAIFLDMNEENIMRQGVIRPGQPGAPANQPAGAP